MEMKRTVASNVLRLRKNKNLSQLTLSCTAHITTGMLGDIEHARANFKLKTLDKIADALEISVCNLFERYEQEAEQPYLLALLAHQISVSRKNQK